MVPMSWWRILVIVLGELFADVCFRLFLRFVTSLVRSLVRMDWWISTLCAVCLYTLLQSFGGKAINMNTALLFRICSTSNVLQAAAGRWVWSSHNTSSSIEKRRSLETRNPESNSVQVEPYISMWVCEMYGTYGTMVLHLPVCLPHQQKYYLLPTVATRNNVWWWTIPGLL